MKTFLLMLFILGCQTDGPIQNADAQYQKDLLIYESGIEIVGLGVLPEKPSYKFDIRSRHNPDIVRISNCHRDIIMRNQNKSFSFNFSPNMAVERGSCILQINFLDSKGFHQFGALTFKPNADNLSASVSCNGSAVKKFDGASVCQGKSGTIQNITFDLPVEIKSSCLIPKSDDAKSWPIVLRDGYCMFLFKNSKDEFHSLTTFGYNEIINQ